MAKLFNVDPVKENFDVSNKKISKEELIEAKIENDDISDVINVYNDSMNVAIEGITKASNDLKNLYEVRSSLESKKLSTREYFISVENYSLYLKSIANNLGVKIKIPSMEDFKNPYSVKVCHEVVMEGFSDFIRAIWERIKKFFKDFFKKILLFFKRLTNSDLQLEEYEEYIESLMKRVRNSQKSKATPVKIDSRLPLFLAPEDINSMTTAYLLTKGKQKLINLVDFIQRLTNDLDKGFKPKFEKEINVLISALKEKDNLTEEKINKLRNNILETFDVIFKTPVEFKNLPVNVQNEVMNAYDTSEIKNSDFYTAIFEKNSDYKLPKNFNLFQVRCKYEVNVGVGENEVKFESAKTSIVSNIETNNSVSLTIETISSKDDLLHFYDFYRDFSKKVNTNNILKIMEGFEKQIDKFTKVLGGNFDHAMDYFKVATENSSKDEGDVFNGTATSSGDNIKGVGGIFDQPNTPTPETGKNDEEVDVNKLKIVKILEELNNFTINYLTSIQILLKEISVNLIGLHKECRYELIKYLYQSAKQF